MRRSILWMTPLLLACSVLGAPLAPLAPSMPAPTPMPQDGATLTPLSPSTEAAPPTETPSPSFPDPSAFAWSPVAGGFDSPIDVQHAGDERLYVVEQGGVIRIIQDGAVLDELFLDIRDRVYDGGNEQGLLGLAFHPDFAANGFFYVNYTRGTGDTVIARFRAGSPTAADPESEQRVLFYDQPFPNHNGGGMVFGPDGMLYIGSGDGGAAGDPGQRAQDLGTLLGKLLRIDVDAGDPYAIPPDNPFADGGGDPEIWAYGLRNPWRFAFDPVTADLYIGDVGQDQWEEIDHVPAGSPAGSNFGWDFREGPDAYEGVAPTGLVEPVAYYSHDEGGCSVTGGVVVRDPALPEWQGVYLYGDYCSGLIWGLLRDSDGAWQNRVVFDTDFRITSFGIGVDGAIYLLDRLGVVYHLTRAG